VWEMHKSCSLGWSLAWPRCCHHDTAARRTGWARTRTWLLCEVLGRCGKQLIGPPHCVQFTAEDSDHVHELQRLLAVTADTYNSLVEQVAHRAH
jgi:hypothetical protein